MLDIDLNLVRVFAIAAHAAVGQKRVTGEPYSDHPERVVAILRSAGFNRVEDRPLLAAAYLHDVLEDTRVTKELLGQLFGIETMGLVVALSDVYTKAAFPALNRASRKELEHRRMGTEEWRVQTIKCADVIDNAGRLAQYPDKKFARSYVLELRDLVVELTRAEGNLLALARQTVECAILALAD
jgi:guanosine-3',5'-bis(diphosphate) 3'-pyrophosphohydrolase